jgi:hypothetical protein
VLTYLYPDGRAAGVVMITSAGLLHAPLNAALAGPDREVEFASGHQLDQETAGQIPANMMGRLLDNAISGSCGGCSSSAIGATADGHQATGWATDAFGENSVEHLGLPADELSTLSSRHAPRSGI